jgi:HAD superfamily hydrolase (TIGR01509 family)
MRRTAYLCNPRLRLGHLRLDIVAVRMPYQAVALDAMGVIYTNGDDLRQLLIPYLRTKGCQRTDEELRLAYRACYREGASVETLWAATGLAQARERFEDAYLRLYELNSGVVAFLDEMRARRVPVYGVSNDIAEWSIKRRRLHALEDLFAGWIISSEVRAIKPDMKIFRQLLGHLKCPPAECVFVDDRVENLDGAKAVGLTSTVLFGTTAEAPHHATVATFEELREFVLTRAHA